MTTLLEKPHQPLAAPSPKWRWLALAALAIVAAAIIAHVTANAMGVGVDSVDYIAGAWTLNNGRGLQLPSGEGSLETITHFPPLTSVFLAAGEWLGIEVVQWSRWTSVFFFAASAVLAARIAVRHARTVWPGIIAGVLVITDVDMLKHHALVASEPPFFFLMFLSLWWLIGYLENGRKRLLIGTSVTAALSLLTRYPGVVLGLLGMLCVLLLAKGNRKRRIWHALLYGAIAFAPGAAWALHNKIVAGTATDREFAFHLPTRWTLHEGALTVTHWFLPEFMRLGHPKRWLAALFLIVGILLLLAWRKKPAGAKAGTGLQVPSIVLLTFALLYGMLVAATVLFFDAATPLDGRILLPLYFAITILAAIWVDRFLSFVPWRSAVFVATISIVAVVIAARIRAAQLWVVTDRDAEKMFAIEPWATSEIFSYLRTQPANVKIVSNETSALYFYNGYLVWEPPDKWNYYTRKINPHYKEDLAEMAARLQKDGGLIVLFNQKMIPYRTDLSTLEDLKAAVPTREVFRTPEGVVLEVQAAR